MSYSEEEENPWDDEQGGEWEDFDEPEQQVSGKVQLDRVVISDAVKPLRGKPRTQRFCTFDLETWRWEHPYLASFYTGQGEPVTFESEPVGAPWLRGRDPGRSCVAQFLDYFLRREFVGRVCYAHNGGKFDFLFLLWEFEKGRGFFERGFRWKLRPIQSGIFRIYVTHPNIKQAWVFSDSLRLLPMSLDKVGKAFEVGRKTDLRAELGLPPVPKNASREKVLASNAQVFEELAKPRNRAIARKYNRLDCQILYDGLKKYETQLNAIGGEMKATTPSSSIDVFRRKFQRRDIFTNKHLSTCSQLGKIASSKCRACGHAAIRAAYAGGRTEIMTMRGKDLNYYDYNSHYLACMAERMPADIATVIDGGDEASVYRSMKGGHGIGIIDCDVKIPEDCYLPPLPWKEGVGGSAAKLLFPVGTFSGSWDTEELRLLPLIGGRITKVRRQLWFGASDIFSDFVAAIWEYRKNGSTAALRELAKLLGNSNYGKWAQRPESLEYFVDPTEAQALKQQLVPYLGLEALGVFVGESLNEPKHIAPALSTHICSIARSRLWRKGWEVLQRLGRLYYMDTDSVIVSGYHQEDSKELGGMKLEHHIYRSDFILPKSYEFECYADCPGKDCKEVAHVIKAKGLGRGLGAPVDYDEWLRLINTSLPPEMRKVLRQRISQWRESLKAHAKTGRQYPFIKNEPKGILSPYEKRTILQDGVNTHPRIVRNNQLVVHG